MVSSLDFSCMTVHDGVMRRSVARPEVEGGEVGMETIAVMSDGVASILMGREKKLTDEYVDKR